MVVTVFSEHPSLLSGADREAWTAVSDERANALGERLARVLPAEAALRLRLHGYAITPDGSMVVLFVEHEEAQAGGVTGLRERLGGVGRGVLGSLNSRPKRLLHVTAGRLLDWPTELLDADARRSTTRVVHRWAMSLVAGALTSARGGSERGEVQDVGVTRRGSQSIHTKS